MDNADRIQRMMMGFLLMVLNLIGNNFTEWTAIVALVLQVELFLTGLIGWCPFYWSLRKQ